MRLSELTNVLWLAEVIGPARDPDVTGFAIDSRLVQPGDLFVALSEPEMADRHEFAAAAAAAGAVAVLVQRPVEVDVPQVVVPDVSIASGLMAGHFFGRPADSLRLVAVTGTKGKTTTSFLTHHILSEAGRAYGLLGTVVKRIGDRTEPSSNTTLHAVHLQKTLREMRDAGLEGVIAEVSSHALKLHRLTGARLAAGAFTNLGHDHLNFHPDQADYAQAKALLFAHLGLGGAPRGRSYAVINGDDAYGSLMQSHSAVETLRYGLGDGAELRATDIEADAQGTRFVLQTPWGAGAVTTLLVGEFNVYNVLAAVGLALGEGVPLERIVAAIAGFKGVPGRLERVDDGVAPFTVVVDYAHTTESLQAIVKTLAALRPHRLITLFGCGGDRDRTKRPEMARVATELSDLTVFTSDNPRTEDPEAILDEVERGAVAGAKTRRIADRRLAIAAAIDAAVAGDIVLIAGKGHEDYQILGHTKHPFDDRVEARKAIADRFGKTRRV
ncbi:MAG TPA: UDP-N-acetylmuramoyl-L-alanyl-D-glutamate--2,6-diaminopimelate ligase [Limnochordia bacterium]|nr:UDP-N-acetylmuramoyl-L-alanyl-D-glutamate--2,6-diaminopimelate ligase [Limnochordia bacterium]